MSINSASYNYTYNENYNESKLTQLFSANSDDLSVFVIYITDGVIDYNFSEILGSGIVSILPGEIVSELTQKISLYYREL